MIITPKNYAIQMVRRNFGLLIKNSDKQAFLNSKTMAIIQCKECINALNLIEEQINIAHYDFYNEVAKEIDKLTLKDC